MSRATLGWGAGLVLAGLAAVALVLTAFTPALIVPFRTEMPWFESAASFPRAALALVALGAAIELLRRRHGGATVASEELDSSAAQLPRVAAVLALFVAYALLVPVLGFAVASALFVALAGRAVGLSWWRAAVLALPLAAALWLVFVSGLKVAFGHGWLL